MEGTKYDLVFCDTQLLTTLGGEETDFKETPRCSSRIEQSIYMTFNKGGSLFSPPLPQSSHPTSIFFFDFDTFSDRTAPQSSGGGWERDGVWQIPKGSEASILQKLPFSETLYKGVEMPSIPTAK